MTRFSGDLPSRKQLGLPEVLAEVAKNDRGGLILVCGGPGSGVSTTLNWMLDFLNMTIRTHLMIFEQRSEVIHYHKLSMISQREKGRDYQDLCLALREAPRQGASVVLIGEPLDNQALVLSAELGHHRNTVLASLPGESVIGVLTTVRESLGPLSWQRFAAGLSAIVHQRLLVGRYGERVPVFEILRKTFAVANVLREEKLRQLLDCMETGSRWGMQTLEQALHEGVRQGLFSAEEALRQAADPQRLRLYLEGGLAHNDHNNVKSRPL